MSADQGSIQDTTDIDFVELIQQMRSAHASGALPQPVLRKLLAAAVASQQEQTASPGTPTERLALQLSAEVYRWILKRRATGRTLGVPRRTLARCLKAKNITVSSVAEIADALGCIAVVEFRDLGVCGATSGARGAK